MALRETLKAAAAKAAEAAQAEADKPRIILEWQETVRAFNNRLRGWLTDYEADGSIAVRAFKVDYREEYLGQYEAEAMELKAGPYIILVKPVGRMIFGAVGRIDMFRQGKGDEGSAVRFIHVVENDPEAWRIRKPQSQWQGSAIVATPRPLELLDARKFEEALDELLQS